MTTIKYDVSNVEPGQDYSVPVPADVYLCRITEAEERESRQGNDMIALTLEIAKGPHKGRNLWDNIVLIDTAEWKMRQFIDALGRKEKGSLNLERDVVGTEVQVRVKHETDDREEVKEANGGKPIVRARVAALLPLPGEGEDDDDAPADDDVPASEDNSEDDDELTYEDLVGYDREQLEEVVDENELEVTYNKRTKDDVLRQRIAEELGLEPAAEEETEGEDDEEEDYNEWSIPDLRKELKSRDLPTAGKKSALVKRLEADDADDDGDEPF